MARRFLNIRRHAKWLRALGQFTAGEALRRPLIHNRCVPLICSGTVVMSGRKFLDSALAIPFSGVQVLGEDA
jgi:hypothetical protein